MYVASFPKLSASRNCYIVLLVKMFFLILPIAPYKISLWHLYCKSSMVYLKSKTLLCIISIFVTAFEYKSWLLSLFFYGNKAQAIQLLSCTILFQSFLVNLELLYSDLARRRSLRFWMFYENRQHSKEASLSWATGKMDSCVISKSPHYCPSYEWGFHILKFKSQLITTK